MQKNITTWLAQSCPIFPGPQPAFLQKALTLQPHPGLPDGPQHSVCGAGPREAGGGPGTQGSHPPSLYNGLLARSWRTLMEKGSGADSTPQSRDRAWGGQGRASCAAQSPCRRAAEPTGGSLQGSEGLGGRPSSSRWAAPPGSSLLRMQAEGGGSFQLLSPAGAQRGRGGRSVEGCVHSPPASS